MISGAVWYVNSNKTPDTNLNASNNNSATNVINNTSPSPSTAPAAVNSNQSTNSNSAKSVSKTITFQVPENHTNTITVNVTLSSGKISDISYSQNSTNRESREYYNNFVSNFSKSSVVGKDISGVNLSRVGGASLTTGAFNQALSQIASELN